MDYAKMLETVRAFWPARVILTATELGVAGALAGGSHTAEEVATRLDSDPRATGFLLDALSALGLVEKIEGRYRNVAWAEERLVPGADGYAGDGLWHSVHLWRSWSHLTESVRTGEPLREERERSVEEYHQFVGAMYDYGFGRAREVAGLLDLSASRRLLDLGGGPGSYAIAFCERNDELTAAVFDRPPALDVARRKISHHGLENRIELISGDFLEDDLGEGWDCVWASHIIHSYGPEENAALVERVHSAMKPGGRFFLQDFYLEDDRVSPPPSALFTLNMLVNTDHGRTYAWAEAEEWLGAAGFRQVRRVETPAGAGVLEGTR